MNNKWVEANNFTLPQNLNTEGCYRLAIAVIQNLTRSMLPASVVTRYHRFNRTKYFNSRFKFINDDYKNRIDFVEKGMMFKIVVDCLGYDYDKIKNALIKKIDALYEREIGAARQEKAKEDYDKLKRYNFPIWNVKSAE